MMGRTFSIHPCWLKEEGRKQLDWFGFDPLQRLFSGPLSSVYIRSWSRFKIICSAFGQGILSVSGEEGDRETISRHFPTHKSMLLHQISSGQLGDHIVKVAFILRRQNTHILPLIQMNAALLLADQGFHD